MGKVYFSLTAIKIKSVVVLPSFSGQFCRFTVEIKKFVRFELGEGIEKKEDNFVEEVMAQVRT